jgi:glycosyltransferase involved in cell wall biosynthesis
MRRVEFVERDPGADVLIVTNLWPDADWPVYGIFVRRQVESLRAAGLRCDVLYIRGWRSAWAYPEAALRMAVSTVTWRHRYRVVHVHSGEAALAARFHLGAPMVASYLGDDVLGDRDKDGHAPPAARLRRRLIGAHSRLFTATITKSREMERALPARTRRKNHVLPNGVDRELFVPIDRGEARALLGWGDEPVALFVGTRPYSARKRLWLAEAACNAAGVRLHVAAEAAPGTMPTLMSGADCLIVTSSLEGSPNAVKEALMCNLPVISTAVGDVEERLQGVEPSWLCLPTASAFEAALRECLSLGRRSNGRDVAADLDERRVAARLLDIYREVGG